MTTIRSEVASDVAAIHAVHVAAFPTDAEARLVDALREAGRLSVSLVAEEDGLVIGHITFSPVTTGDTPGGLGLAPVAVHPDAQRRGVGGMLILDGLKAAARTGAAFVVVLGHAAYYPRFGFRRADELGLSNEYGAGAEFMAMELVPGSLAAGGLVQYAPEFQVLS